MKLFCVIVLFFIGLTNGQAQDVITLKDGEIIETKITEIKTYQFTKDRPYALKLNITGTATGIAVASGIAILTFEKSIKPAYSIEASMKFIGLGGSNSWVDGGYAFDMGPKFKILSILKKSYRPKHLLHGGYLKPTVGLNFVNVYNDDSNNLNTIANFGMNLGSQMILGNRISVDTFIGAHYITKRGSNLFTGDLVGAYNFGFSYGLNVGYLFNLNKK